MPAWGRVAARQGNSRERRDGAAIALARGEGGRRSPNARSARRSTTSRTASLSTVPARLRRAAARVLRNQRRSSRAARGRRCTRSRRPRREDLPQDQLGVSNTSCRVVERDSAHARGCVLVAEQLATTDERRSRRSTSRRPSSTSGGGAFAFVAAQWPSRVHRRDGRAHPAFAASCSVCEQWARGDRTEKSSVERQTQIV